jgi:hypothetical protein
MIDKFLKFAAEQLEKLLCLFIVYETGKQDGILKQQQMQNNILQKQLEVVISSDSGRDDIIKRVRNGQM